MMLPGSPGLNRVVGTQIVAFKRLGVFRAGRGVDQAPPFKNSRRKKNHLSIEDATKTNDDLLAKILGGLVA